MSIEIEIFRTGTHTASGGQVLGFSAEDLAAIARGYDAESHRAPIVVGHPAHDAPAYGWVAGLRVEGDRLLAEVDQVDEQFAELVRAGRFKTVSPSFYVPGAPQHPGGEGYALRHVGFLGAQPPAVKGLKPASFGDDAEGVVAFEETTKSAEGPAGDVPPVPLSPDTTKETDPVSTETDAKALAEKEAALAQRAEELAAREAKIAAAEEVAARGADAAFLEGLVAEGRPLPRESADLVAFMASLRQGAAVVSFAEGEESDLHGAFKAILKGLPKAVDFGERAPADGDGGPVDASVGDIAKAAVAFQEEQRRAGVEIPIRTAVDHVMKGNGK